MKPLDISKSQIEGVLQQSIQSALVHICSEAAVSVRPAHEFLLSEGEQVIPLVVNESFERNEGIYRPQLENMASEALMKAIAVFGQRTAIDSKVILDYLHSHITEAVQQVVEETLTRYANCAADREASLTDDEIEATLFGRVDALAQTQTELNAEMNKNFRPKAEAMLAANDVKGLQDLLNRMPACNFRMTLAGMYAQHQHTHKQDETNPNCTAL